MELFVGFRTQQNAISPVDQSHSVTADARTVNGNTANRKEKTMRETLTAIVVALISAIPGTGTLILSIIQYRDSKKNK